MNISIWKRCPSWFFWFSRLEERQWIISCVSSSSGSTKDSAGTPWSTSSLAFEFWARGRIPVCFSRAMMWFYKQYSGHLSGGILVHLLPWLRWNWASGKNPFRDGMVFFSRGSPPRAPSLCCGYNRTSSQLLPLPLRSFLSLCLYWKVHSPTFIYAFPLQTQLGQDRTHLLSSPPPDLFSLEPSFLWVSSPTKQNHHPLAYPGQGPDFSVFLIPYIYSHISV